MKRKSTKIKAKKQLSMEVFKDIRANSGHVTKSNSGILILLFSLFIISITLLTVGIFKGKSDESVEIQEPKNIESEDNSESITDYFDEAFSKSSAGSAQDEVYLQSDPFQSECADTAGDGIPAISFGTVCYR